MGALAVLGPGGVGGLVAAALQRGGEDVIVIARAPTADGIARDGLEVDSVRLGRFKADPRTATRLTEPVDALFVATKATGLDEALERVDHEPGLVVPLLNGLEHLPRLRKRFGSRAVAATIRVESDRPRLGQIKHTSQFLLVELASADPQRSAAVEDVAQRLEASEIPARVRDSEAQVLWSKLVRLNALACATAASDRPLGFVRSDPGWSAALSACVEEAAAVAVAEGARIRSADVLAELANAHAGLGSSLQRDVAAGREPELDHIAGAVLRAGARHGLACPTIERLAARIAERAAVPAPSAAQT